MSLRVYIIGAGYIARRHAQAVARLQRVDEVELTVGARRPEALTEFARQFPGARACADIQAMLGASSRADDIVIVATPPSTHARFADLALRSGRHVLCEKPLALNAAEGHEMLRAARGSGRLLGCCSTRFIGSSASRQVKRLVGSGALGRLYHASFVNRRQRNRAGIDDDPGLSWFRDPVQSGGGVLMDMAPYDFTALNDVLAPVAVRVHSTWMANPQARSDSPGAAECDLEQHAGASLEYVLAEGATMAVTYERAGCTHGPPRVIAEVEGSAGAVAWDWFDLDAREVSVTYLRDREGRAEGTRTTYRNDGPLVHDDRPLSYFVDRVHGRESPAVVNERAVFNFLCVRALYDCVATGRPQALTMKEVTDEDH